MGVDVSAFISKWGAAADAFNRDDLQPLADLLADDCEFTASGSRIGSTRDEIVNSLKQGRANGWTRHLPLSLTSAGDFVATVFRNESADGSSFVGAGIIRLDGSGRMCEIVTLEPPAARPGAGER